MIITYEARKEKMYRVFSMSILSFSAADWTAATSASSIVGPK